MQIIIQIIRQAQKDLQKAPIQVQRKFKTWSRSIRLYGLETVRQTPAYHDEPLHGKRKGQRSIRLNRHWRAIYEETENQGVIVTVLEVTAHDYRTR